MGSCGVLEIASRCEAALLPLEIALVDSRRRAERAENQSVALGDLVQKLIQRLQTLPCLAEDLATPRQPLDATEISTALDAAVAAICRELQGRRGSSSSWARPSTPLTPKTLMRANAKGSRALANAAEAPIGDLNKRTASGKKWEENTENCGVCSAKFGWWLLKRRHHCRSCGRCVCSMCSPNFLILPGGKRPVRVCTPCLGQPSTFSFASRTTPDLGSRPAAAAAATFCSTSSNFSRRSSKDGGAYSTLSFCEEESRGQSDNYAMDSPWTNERI